MEPIFTEDQLKNMSREALIELMQVMQEQQRKAETKLKLMEEKQKEMETKEFEGTAGGGVVTVRLNGKREVLGVTLAEEVVDPDDIETLEDLVAAAVGEALRKVEEASSASMDQITGGLGGFGGGFPF